MKDRTILHCDLNNFFASVECFFAPELKKVPVAVCGSKEERHGIVLAKNELAKKCGVKTAEAIWQAKKKCPDLVTVPPHYDKYVEFSERAKNIYRDYTDRIEPFGIDECWLDVTGCEWLFGSGEEIAHKIRRRIKHELGITASVGVSFNKVFAKLGSDLKKPDAVTVISHENYKEKIWNLPADSIIGVGRKTIKVLNNIGIETIGDIGTAPEGLLKELLGKNGEALRLSALGLDNSPVVDERDSPEAKSIGRSVTCRYSLTSWEDISRVAFSLCEKICYSMQKNCIFTDCIKVSIKNDNLSVLEKQKKIIQPTNSPSAMYNEAKTLLKELWNGVSPVRAVGVYAASLTETGSICQLSFDSGAEELQKRDNLEESVFMIRSKYGTNMLKRAVLLDELPYSSRDDGQNGTPVQEICK